MDKNSEIKKEQKYVDDLFARIDNEVTTANERLKEVMLRVDRSDPDPEDLVRRETEYHSLNSKLDRLTIAQLGLVFGRIDIESNEPENPVPGAPGCDRRYIGRMGIDDKADHYRTLLLDWRAPMARPFYLATTAHPEGVHVRRHIRTRGRVVTGVDDEVLIGSVGDGVDGGGVASESSLMLVLNRARSEHMVSIVETIQREQDDIIRDPTRGVMVVEGGPGTGKTAVALHRVAYLLYTWRELLEKRGVLIIGPNATFLEYISRVLPELGETGVVLATVGDLFPGVRASREDSLLVREVKGSGEMVAILSEAVKAYQTIPEKPVEVVVDGIRLPVDGRTVAKARTRARRSRQKHNLAQPIFIDALTELLAHQMAGVIGKDLLTPAQVDALHDDLLDDADLVEFLASFWPVLEPTQVLYELFRDRDRIAFAARRYDEVTQEALFHEEGYEWSVSDVALLDELAFIIGTVADEEDKENGRPVHFEQAQEALDALMSSVSTDAEDEVDNEVLSAHDVIDARALAQRQEEVDYRSTAQRAAADLSWAYGHVIVDEAQELSAMEWRMVMRRCPSRWMTLVGDVAQTGSPAGVESWVETLAPFVDGRFRHHRLSVNYRTPEEVMELANALLALIDPDAQGTVAIRRSYRPISYLPSGTDPYRVKEELEVGDPGRSVAIIDASTIGAFKGLEFDHVVVVEPHDFIDGSPQGLQDLYVAVTRATQSLTVIGSLDLESLGSF